jgi:hypothetical protein
MSTITIRRSDVTTQEVGDALRDGLDARYHVLSGRAIKANPVTAPSRINPARSWLAPAPTWPGGVKLANRPWIARKAHQVFLAAPGLRWIGGHSAVRARRQAPVRGGGS